MARHTLPDSFAAGLLAVPSLSLKLSSEGSTSSSRSHFDFECSSSLADLTGSSQTDIELSDADMHFTCSSDGDAPCKSQSQALAFTPRCTTNFPVSPSPQLIRNIMKTSSDTTRLRRSRAHCSFLDEEDAGYTSGYDRDSSTQRRKRRSINVHLVQTAFTTLSESDHEDLKEELSPIRSDLQSTDRGLGLGLPTSYSLAGSVCTSEPSIPPPVQFGPVELADDMSPIQTLPSPAFPNAKFQQSVKRRHLAPMHSQLSSTQDDNVAIPPTPRLRPILLPEELSPIESLPSPLAPSYTGSLSARSNPRFWDPQAHQSATSSFHNLFSSSSIHPPGTSSKKSWTFGLGFPSAIISNRRSTNTEENDNGGRSPVLIAPRTPLPAQNLSPRNRIVPVRPPPPSSPMEQLSPRFISRLRQLPRHRNTPFFVAQRLHSINEA